MTTLVFWDFFVMVQRWRSFVVSWVWEHGMLRPRPSRLYFGCGVLTDWDWMGCFAFLFVLLAKKEHSEVQSMHPNSPLGSVILFGSQGDS